MPTTRYRARVITSEPIPAYGGVQFPENEVERLAAELATGKIPMTINHDRSRRVPIVVLAAGTERLDSGYLAAWLEYEADSDHPELVAHAEQLDLLSLAGGFSVTVTQSLDSDDERPSALVAADAHHFRDDEIRAAQAVLRSVEPAAGASRLYQFATEPMAVVVLELGLGLLATLGPSILASVIYDVAKHFFTRKRRPGSPTVLDVKLKETPEGERSISLHVEASDAEELRATLASLPPVLVTGSTGLFTAAGGSEFEAKPSVVEDPDAGDGEPERPVGE